MWNSIFKEADDEEVGGMVRMGTVHDLWTRMAIWLIHMGGIPFLFRTLASSSRAALWYSAFTPVTGTCSAFQGRARKST